MGSIKESGGGVMLDGCDQNILLEIFQRNIVYNQNKCVAVF